jgi:uncharacterized protein YggE
VRVRLAAAIVLASWVGAAAQQEGKDTPRTIRVAGNATTTAAPDQAQIDLGVLTQAQTAKEAASENAKRVEGVIAAARQALGAKADLKTIGYSVNPIYGEAKPNRGPAVTGYSVDNVVRVTTGDLAPVGKLLDAAIAAGANDVRGLSFSLKDQQPVRAQALREAVGHARSEAEAIASSLGVKLGRVRSVEAAGEPPVVRPMMMGAAMARAATPVEPGTIEVHASVTVTFEIGD